MLCARLGLVFVGLMGLWRMKTWGLFMLTAGVAWALWLHYQTGVFSLLSFKLPIIALAASFYYCFRKPANKVSRPDVHYYSGVGIDKETDSSEGAENQSEDKNTSSKKGSDTSENKSALEELIY